jgi:DNA (cytosine-5)-methyltransferase 1
MARIQSFPDGFVFKSKVTTGGQMRKYEVPQYTQVGNAVPPLLGFAIGSVVKRLLDKIE